MAWRIPIFRIFYSSTFLFFVIVCILFLSITPGDHIFQTVSNDKLGNVFVVGGVYVGVFAIAFFIYFSRLYTRRVTLGSIPKTYLPIDKGEVPTRVYKEILHNRHRSSLIAWESKPKDLSAELESEERAIEEERLLYQHGLEEEAQDNDSHLSPVETTGKSPTHSQFSPVNSINAISKPFRMLKRMRKPVDHALEKIAKGEGDTVIIPIKASDPPWGIVMHPGWSSPSTVDLPGLQFDLVIDELPNLIEAKAVSLAPPDPAYAAIREYQGSGKGFDFMQPHSSFEADVPPPDRRAIAVLQRPAAMSLRGYITHLIRLGIIDAPNLAEPFLKQYEYARFSTEMLFESEFRTLMVSFSDLLGSMIEVAPDVLIAEAEMTFGGVDDDDYDDDDYDDYDGRDVQFITSQESPSKDFSGRQHSAPAFSPEDDVEDDTGSVLHHQSYTNDEESTPSDGDSVIHHQVEDQRLQSQASLDTQSFESSDSTFGRSP